MNPKSYFFEFLLANIVFQRSWRLLLRKNLPPDSLACQTFGVLGRKDFLNILLRGGIHKTKIAVDVPLSDSTGKVLQTKYLPTYRLNYYISQHLR